MTPPQQLQLIIVSFKDEEGSNVNVRVQFLDCKDSITLSIK